MRFLRALVFTLTLFDACVAMAQTKWDMPTPYGDSFFHTLNNRQFAEEVKKATGGQIELVVHSNQSLLKHVDILRGVQTGQVPIGEILLSQFGNEDPMFEVDALPFLAAGYDAAQKFYQVQKPYVEKRMAARGIRVLFSVPWPGQGIYTKTPLKVVEDLKGAKFRTYSPGTSRLAELLGAVPTTVQLSEIAQAFTTNIVTAMITSAAGGVGPKAWEYSKYFYETSAFLPRNAVIVNERTFQRLPESQRNAILKAAADAEVRGWDLSRKDNTSAVKTLSDNGMTIVKPDAAMMAAFSRAGEIMVGEWQKKAGPEGDALIKAYRAK